jgi:uncharacterized protein YggE
MRPFVLLLTLAVVACAQTTPNSVQASGNATRNVKPDMAQLQVGVITQATTADAAASQNATLTDSVMKALQVKLGDNGTIQTLYYSISPRYATANGQTTLTGYTVTNTLQVITTNVSLVGPLIDAANGAGANNISGPYFGLQNSDPEIQLALTAASKQALAHAAAIASGLGAKTGAVLAAQEGSVVRPIVEGTAGGAAATATSTPIQTGTVSVTAYVTVTVALVQ